MNKDTDSFNIGDAFSTLSSLTRGIIGARMGQNKKLDSTFVDKYRVSTVDTVDCGLETAICAPNGTHVVQRYATEEEALKGHQAWTKFLEDGHRKIIAIGFGIIGDEEIIIE